MKKNQGIMFVSIGLIVLGIYYIYKQSKEGVQPENELDSATASQNNNSTSAKPDWNKVLKKGSIGIEVERLQQGLKGLTVDGNFGALTELRLKNVMGVTQASVNQYNEFIKNKALKK